MREEVYIVAAIVDEIDLEGYKEEARLATILRKINFDDTGTDTIREAKALVAKKENYRVSP